MPKDLSSTDPVATAPALTPEEEAALAAQVSADHAAKAVEQAEADATAAARAASDTPVCPNDNTPLFKHDGANPYKQGAWHCNSCGTCWAPGIKHPR